MKKVFIKDIKEKDHVAESFLVTKKDLGISKSGKALYNIEADGLNGFRSRPARGRTPTP